MNNQKWIIGAGIAVVVVLLAAILAPLALAQTPLGTPFGSRFYMGQGGGRMGMMQDFAARGGRGGRMGQGNGRGAGFVDNDGDGVCDNAGQGGGGRGGRMGQGGGRGAGFVDNDGDGVCDNAGQGNGGRGAGFVDNNGDGVCDHMQNQNAAPQSTPTPATQQ